MRTVRRGRLPWIRSLVAALASGAALVGSCSEPTAPVEPPEPAPYLLTIAESAVVLDRIGATVALNARLTQGGQPRVRPLIWWSGAPLIVRVNADGLVQARSRGSTWVFATSDSGGLDSALVVFDQRPTTMRFAVPALSILHGRVTEISVLAFDAGGHPAPTVQPTFVSSDTTVAQVNVPARGVPTVTARAPGSAEIVATIGTVHATLPLTVRALPPFRVVYDTLRLHAHSIQDIALLVYADSVADGEQAAVTVTVADTNIAWVTPLLMVPRRAGDQELRVEGRAIGSTRLVLSSPDRLPDTAVVVVAAQRLFLGDRIQRVRYPVLVDAGIAVQPASGSALIDPVSVSLRTSDPTVATLRAPTVELAGAGPAVQLVDLLRIGETDIIATAPGLLPDTIRLQVIERGLDMDAMFGDERELRVGYRRPYRVLTDYPRTPESPDLPLTFNQARPDLVRIPTEPMTVGNSLPPEFSLHGLRAGVDTVVVSAPGVRPDTLVITVRMPENPFPPQSTSVRDFALSPFEMSYLGEFDFWSGPVPLGFRVTSSDTTVAKPESEFFGGLVNRIGFSLRATGIGTATLSATDTLGVHPPAVLGTVDIRRGRLHLYAPDLPPGGATLGVRQRRSVGLEAGSFGSSGCPGTLRSSDTSMVQVSASAFTTLPRELEIESGNAPGTAWVIAECYGFVPESLSVRVTRGLVSMGAPREYWLGYGSPNNFLNVWVTDADGNPRVTRDTLRVRVTSGDKQRLLLTDSVVTILPGATFSDAIRFTTVALGPVAVQVTPLTPFPAWVDAGSTVFTITVPGSQVREGGRPEE